MAPIAKQRQRTASAVTGIRSAQGLWRATGKPTKPISVDVEHDLLGAVERPVHLAREKDDFYPTPPEPTRAFLRAEIGRLREIGTVWEPAAGDGAMVREMEALGLRVIASDLIDRGCAAELRNFYDWNAPPANAIVTNPPFGECSWGNGRARWLKHALVTLRVEYMALLLPWAWPSAAGLAPFWAAYPPARIYLMRWKIDFTGQGAPPSNHAWFIWDVRARGETLFRTLDRRPLLQSDLFAAAAA